MNKLLYILKEFQKLNPELVYKMKACDHHFDSNNLTPFHLESDVWTHTMLMYNQFLHNQENINHQKG